MAATGDSAAAAWPSSFFQGYARSIRGERLAYHSPDPDVDHSLLVRSLEGTQDIEWETAALPTLPDVSDRASFLWLFGIDVNSDRHAFELWLNGSPLLSFANPTATEPRCWTVTGRDGAELTFRATLVDKYDDLMGYAVLTVSRRLLRSGQPQVLRVKGESAGSRTWYMTFETAVAERCLIRPLDLLTRRDGRLWRTVLFEFTHVGAPVQGTVRIEPVAAATCGSAIVPAFAATASRVEPTDSPGPPGAAGSTALPFAPAAVSLSPGHNPVAVELPEVEEETGLLAVIRLGDGPDREERFTLRPARRWTVSLVQHTHTDIGYTRPQAEILADHLRFLDAALDHCDATDHLPAEARFRWTCETSWAVREFLRVRPEEQVERFLRRVREGRIEVTALFLNLSDLLDEPGALAQLGPLREFRERGLPVRTAMQSDINGVPWCLVDQLCAEGVDYMLMAQNTHRAVKPFELPALFRWESRSGNALLVHAGDHYMRGNMLGLLGSDPDSFRDTLLRHLDQLKARGYARDRLLVQFGGFFTDNSPPSRAACTVVRRWNETYEWPKLRLDTAGGFLDTLPSGGEDGPLALGGHDDIPVLRGAWPDWWMDGFGSAPRETAVARVCAGDLLGVQGLLEMVRRRGGAVPEATLRRVEQAREHLLFYAEHTFGAAESISDPTCLNNVVQWGQKAAFAWKAVMECALLREEALGRLASCERPDTPGRSEAQPGRGERGTGTPANPAGPVAASAPTAEAAHIREHRAPSIADAPYLTVFNPLDWPRSGPCEIYIDHRSLPRGSTACLWDDESRPLPMQAGESREDGTYWTVWAADLPALGWRTYRIAADGSPPACGPSSDPETTAGGASIEAALPHRVALRGAFYEIAIDAERGGVVRLVDRGLERDLVDSGSPWALGHLIHERLGNRHQLEGFRLDAVERSGWERLAVEAVGDGPVWQSVRLRAQVPGCADAHGVTCEVRLYKTAKLIELRYALRKLPVTDPEAVYVAFPFGPADATLSWESQGGAVRPGLDQLPGSASDWVGVQGFVAARPAAGQTILCSPETPLVQLGGLNLGQFARIAIPAAPHVFSWVLNNYWTTNFRASEGGELRWRYLITSSADGSDSFAARVGMEAKVRLVGRVRYRP